MTVLTAFPTCKRNIKLRMGSRRNGRVLRYSIFLDGKLVKRAKLKKHKAIALPTLNAGPHRVRVVARTSEHKRITLTRRFNHCVRYAGRKRVKNKHKHKHAPAHN